MTNHEIVRKLIGSINAVRETYEDRQRYENLELTIELVDALLYDILRASSDSNRDEASIKKIGAKAKEYLDEVKATCALA